MNRLISVGLALSLGGLISCGGSNAPSPEAVARASASAAAAERDAARIAENAAAAAAKAEAAAEAEAEAEAAAEAEASAAAKAEADAAAAAAGGQLGSPYPVGDEWVVTVTKLTYPADGLIEQANEFNDPPDGHYVLVDYTAKYVGDEREGNVDFGLSWSWTTSKAVTISDTDKSIVTPADSESRPTEARKGGTLTAQTAFDIDPAVYKGSKLLVEVGGFGDGFIEFSVP